MISLVLEDMLTSMVEKSTALEHMLVEQGLSSECQQIFTDLPVEKITQQVDQLSMAFENRSMPSATLPAAGTPADKILTL